MIIKEIFNDYKNLYTILNAKKGENEEKLTPQKYFVREVIKKENSQKKISSIIELLIPLILFIIVTIIAILNYKQNFWMKFWIGIVWLIVGLFLEMIILMLNVRIINKKFNSKQKAIELIVLAEQFLIEFIMISAHISYLIIK